MWVIGLFMGVNEIRNLGRQFFQVDNGSGSVNDQVRAIKFVWCNPAL